MGRVAVPGMARARFPAAGALLLAALVLLGATDLLAPGPARGDDPNVPPPAPPAPPATPAPAVPPVPEGGPGLDFEPLPSFAARVQTALPSKRADAVRRQKAIDAALAWLASHQADTGAWPAADLAWCDGTRRPEAPPGGGKSIYDAGTTGLALSAFLMAGIGPRCDHPAAANVARGLAWLRSQQDKEGCFGPRSTQHYVYNHAFACLAVLEAYGMTGESALGETARQGLAFVSLSRNPGAGWRYGVRPGENDTSITIAMGACLSVAHAIVEGALAAGSAEPLALDAEAVRGLHAWFDRMTDPASGRAGYVTRGTGSARAVETVDKFPAELVEPLTAGVLLLRRVLPPEGAPDDGKASAALDQRRVALVRALLPAWSVEKGSIDFLHWYYGTLALSVVGGPAWEAWDEALGTALIGAQRADGDVCGVRGSWDPADPWGADGGRVYSTAMGVLCLAGANRYRPISRTDVAVALRTKGLAPHLLALVARAALPLRIEVEDAALSTLAGHASVEVRTATPPLLLRAAARPQPAAAFGALLGDPRPEVRAACVRALAATPAVPPKVVEPLLALLADPRPELVRQVIGVLTRAGDPDGKVAERVEGALAHPDAGVQGAGLRCLWALRPDRAALRDRMARTLSAGPPEERRRALDVLEVPDLDTHRFTADVEACLAHEAAGVQVAAARLLRGTAAHAEAALAATSRGLASPAADVRLAALRLLATWPPGPALPFDALVPLAVSGQRAQRLEAVRVLGRMPAPTPTTLAALYGIGEDGHAALAAEARAALERVTLPPAERARLLASALLAPDAGSASSGALMRRGAVAGLTRLGEAAVPALRDVLGRSSAPPEARAAALGVVARVGHAAQPALAEVLALLELDPASIVRVAAAHALGEPGVSGVTAVPVVMRGLGSKDQALTEACARALARLARRHPEAASEVDVLLRFSGKEPPRSTRALLDEIVLWPEAVARVARTFVLLLGHDEDWLRWAAVEALATLGADAVKLAIPLLDPKDADSQRGRMALVLLERLGPLSEPAMPALLTLLTERAAAGAADALAAVGKPAVSGLARALGHANSSVRMLAARSLGRIGPAASSAAGALRKALKDPDHDVRKEAETALARVKS